MNFLIASSILGDSIFIFCLYLRFGVQGLSIFWESVPKRVFLRMVGESGSEGTIFFTDLSGCFFLFFCYIFKFLRSTIYSSSFDNLVAKFSSLVSLLCKKLCEKIKWVGAGK